MRLRHGVIRTVLDHQEGRAHSLRPLQSVAAGVVERPLRQPGPQGGEARQPHRTGVHRLRIAHVAPPGLAVVGIERGIEEPRIGQRAVHDERPLHLARAAFLQLPQLVLGPRCDAPHAGELRGTVAGDVLVGIRRLVGIARVVDVEFDLAIIGVRLVAHGRVDGLRQQMRP